MAFLKREGIMLCYPADDKRISKLPKTVLVQPKLNGERCRVEWFHGEPILLSSYGNEFKYLDHIKEELCKYPELQWDGELYVHGWSRERVHSAVSRKKIRNPDSELVQFHIFDIQEYNLMQLSRLTLVAQTVDIAQTKVLSVPTLSIARELWLDYCKFYIEQGYEGIIIRCPDAMYEIERSTSILKFKPTEHDIYEIIGYEQEVAITGQAKESLGSFLVTSDEGTVFSVGTGPSLTKELRAKYWAVRDTLVGKQLKVKHELLKTTNSVPVACVAVEVI